MSDQEHRELISAQRSISNNTTVSIALVVTILGAVGAGVHWVTKVDAEMAAEANATLLWRSQMMDRLEQIDRNTLDRVTRTQVLYWIRRASDLNPDVTWPELPGN